MAKLDKHMKDLFNLNFEQMSVHEYAFVFNRQTGRSYMALFTGPMAKHYIITVAHCGEKDIFKKKIGFLQCCDNLANNKVITMPAYGMTITDCLLEFIDNNFPNDYDLESL